MLYVRYLVMTSNSIQESTINISMHLCNIKWISFAQIKVKCVMSIMKKTIHRDLSLWLKVVYETSGQQINS